MIVAENCIHCDLLVIGAGLAGSAAALFAANRGISTVLIGRTGNLQFTSGLLDLLAGYPVEDANDFSQSPWESVARLTADIPMHPFALIDPPEIRQAFTEFLAFLSEVGLDYYVETERNIRIVTSLGTLKTTYALPTSMRHNATALKEKQPCLLIDFEGLKGYSACQIRETLTRSWPGLRSARVAVGSGREYYPQPLADELENPSVQTDLVKAIRQHLRGEAFIGLPAVLGLSAASNVRQALEKQLGLPVFEIPMLPPSLPGLRMKEVLEKHLSGRKGVKTLFQQEVLEANRTEDQTFICHAGPGEPMVTIEARGIILASGRFFGKGLHATRKGIRETLFNLPVKQPESRSLWHHEDLLHPQGHPINLAGLETDKHFRPLGNDGQPVYRNLFAAGTILAHHDWMRMKCGGGLALSTAFGAVNAFLKMRSTSSN